MINFSDHKSAASPLRFFEEITAIPRGSGNTKGIADYLVKFAEDRGLSYIRDGVDNVIISKPATAGYEGKPGVIIQGHTDIVAEKLPECDIDMTKEGPRMYRDGDLLRARGTTLGADDGVAIAYALAVLDSSDISHPDFEAVFTVDEEVGLTGAKMLSADAVKGRMLINIDSDAEGVLTVGCAGGIRADIRMPVYSEDTEGDYYRLSIYGLRGGHSGVDINKGRANSLKLLGKMLSHIERKIRLVSIVGGSADNAIPRDATAVFLATKKLGTPEKKAFDKMLAELNDEGDAEYILERIEDKKSYPTLGDYSTGEVIALLNEMPSGVIKMSEDIEGLVQTSLNMGVARLTEDLFALSFSVRSSKGEERDEVVEKLREIAEGHRAECTTRNGYPAWEYRKDSPLREVMKRVYRELYGSEAKVIIIHAGLECGILSEKLEGLDAVSMGPNASGVHTPDEALSISSFERTWEYIKNLLKNL